jgi:hypothetical protein
MTLYARPLAAALKAALRDTPLACLLGPRQSGKTTLARTLEPRYAYVTFDDAATLAFAQADPTGFVAALPPRAISSTRSSVCPSSCERSSSRWTATVGPPASSSRGRPTCCCCPGSAIRWPGAWRSCSCSR